MTAAHEPNDMDGPHEGPIKTPKQLILAVLYAFVVPIFGIVLLVMFVTAEKRPAAGSDAMSAKAVAERIRPVGMVEVKDASDLASLKNGEQVFTAQCSACHATGALGAPKFGDAGAWAARIKTGLDALIHSAVAGKGQMPPQSGGDFSDYEIARAVVYMTGKAGANFPEPARPPRGQPASPARTPAAERSAPAASHRAGDYRRQPDQGRHARGDGDGRAQFASEGRGAERRRRQGGDAGRGHRRAGGADGSAGALRPDLQHLSRAPASPARRSSATRLHGRRASQKGIRCADRQRDQGQGRDAAEGRIERQSDAEIKTVVTYMVNASK